MGYMGEQGNWIEWTVDDWTDWLKERLEERRQVFLSDPDELIASYNREKSHESGYHGRELIELIQNADDAGIDYTGPNKLLIKLTDFGLFVANTGVPFSPRGIKSLMVSDNSPKQLLRTKCIGYKGLGFRSILGWASSIVILSGKLSIGFNEKFAENWLRNLRRENQKVDVKVREYENSGYPATIATLSIPYSITSESIGFDAKLASIYEEGTKILQSGYDTVVCLLFKNAEKTREQVQKQINSLGNEILLFLQFLERIEIESAGKNDVWTVEREEDSIIVNPDSANPEIWKLFKKEGIIPKDYLKPEQALHDKYEIKLAIPPSPVEVNKLFVFFPTEVRFPFPLVAHATFEVGDSRQHLIDSEVNRFITGQLADLMAEAAEKIKNPDNPWHALSTISPRGDIDLILERFGFLDLLKENAKNYEIIPVRSSHFETPSKSKRIRGNFDKLLTSELFYDLCLHVDDYFIDKQLDNLNVEYLQYEELRNRLNTISDTLTLDRRTELVYLLVENNLIEGEPPELLIDGENKRISSHSPVFFPPEGKVFALPDWVPQGILNGELIASLRNKFSVSRVRDLRLKLELFNVQEYSLNAFVSAIQAESNRRCKERPDEESTLRQQAIQVMWNLYSSSEDKGSLGEKITVILLTRTNKFDSAKNLYFGREYKNGKILEYLYAHIDSASFVASPEKLGFSEISSEIEDFLCWVGVNKTLRYSNMDISSYGNDFLEHVMFSLKYPAKFGEITVEGITTLKRSNKSLKNVTNIDKLEQIITTSDPHAVLCWIAVNPDIDSWRIEGDKNATFEIWPPYKQYGRKLSSQAIPSYPLRLLKTIKWLPIEGGGKLSPNKCCLARGVKDISPIIGFPAVDIEHPLIKELNLDLTVIRNALTKIGVVTDLDELPWDSFYEVLLEMPNLDPEGIRARSIYRKLFSRSEGEIIPAGERYNEFMSKGRMLGKKKGEVKYYPIKQLYYLENITLPTNIADQYPLLEVDKRRGADKVKRIFGVEQLTRDKIQIEITNFEEHPCSQNFQSEIERLKPYIYALRVEEDANRAQLSALRRLKVNLCKSVRVAMLIDNRKEEIELQNGDSINIDSEAYLVADPSDYMRPLLEDHLIADSIGEIISNILKVGINAEIVNIATCPTNTRLLFLDRIEGGSGRERLNKAKELLKIPLEDEEPVFVKPLPWQPPIELGATEGREETLAAEPEIQPSTIGDISVADKGAIIPLPKRLIVRKVQLNPKTSGPSRAKKRADSDRAENLAIEFEKEEKKYPMKISHIRGFDSFGCDILSFKSENDFNTFQKSNDPSLIDRFIEVKGSTSEKGSITLKGNQLRSAQTYRDRFFIYRIYEDESTGIYDLVMVNDPLECERDALEPQYEINPFRSAKSHLWEIEEKDIAEVRDQSLGK